MHEKAYLSPWERRERLKEFILANSPGDAYLNLECSSIPFVALNFVYGYRPGTLQYLRSAKKSDAIRYLDENVNLDADFDWEITVQAASSKWFYDMLRQLQGQDEILSTEVNEAKSMCDSPTSKDCFDLVRPTEPISEMTYKEQQILIESWKELSEWAGIDNE